jgi:quercetin 2,3-dioxygenase
MTTVKRREFLGVTGMAAGSGLLGAALGGPLGVASQAPQVADVPDEILNPVEVSGDEAVPIIGRLPGARRMYVLPADQGEHHLVGSLVMTRVSRPLETMGVHEFVTFAGRSGAAMPRHVHLSSHAALLVLGGEIELELNGQTWQMMRGDFANLPPGTPHGWTMRSDRSKIALFTMSDRVGAAFVAMGAARADAALPGGPVTPIAPGKLAVASFAGDFQLSPATGPAAAPARVTNLVLPGTPGAYVLADGGGERFGGNTFLARNANTMGQFLFIITEGGPGGGVGAHFHARHFENFFALDGETLGWAYGKAVPLKTGDYFQAPPRNLHGFKLTQAYNRFAAFLTPGIFENFFTRGGPGRNGAGREAGGRQAEGGQAPPAGGGRPGGGRGDAGRGQPDPAGRGGAFGLTADMFRRLSMSGRGPDGYPLDVHGAKLPLPPQDPVWTEGQRGANAVVERAALLAHAQAICGVPISREITPELKKALALKPRATAFL